MIERFTTGSYFGTNCYVVSNNGECVVIDPGFDFNNTALKIKEMYQVKAVLITHGHCDHIDGIRYFDCPIYISNLDKKFIFDASYNLYAEVGMKCPYNQNSKLNIITVKDGDILELIGKKFKVIETPGHTKGSVCYYYDSKLLSGDTLFRESVGRTDFPTGDMVDMRNSLKKLFELIPDNTDVYPGHNEKTTMKYERQNNPYKS